MHLRSKMLNSSLQSAHAPSKQHVYAAVNTSFIAPTESAINTALMGSSFDRLMERLNELAWSMAELGRRIGESNQTLHNWKKRGNIPAEKSPKVAAAIGVHTDWLMLGVEPKLRGTAETAAEYNVQPIDELRSELEQLLRELTPRQRAELFARLHEQARDNREIREALAAYETVTRGGGIGERTLEIIGEIPNYAVNRRSGRERRGTCLSVTIERRKQQRRKDA